MYKDLFSKHLKISDFKNLLITLFSGFFIFYSAQIFPVVIFAFVLGVVGLESDEISELFSDNHFFQSLFLTVVASLTIFLIYKYLIFRREKPLQFLLLKNKVSWSNVGEVIVTYGLYFFTFVVVASLLNYFTTINVDQSQDLGISDPTTGTAKLFVFISLVVLPPIYEEIMFRGFLFNSLNKYSSTIISYGITSVLFGIAHLEYGNLNWIAVVDTLIFSVFLIYISQKHKSIYSSMLLHGMKNSIAYYVLFIR